MIQRPLLDKIVRIPDGTKTGYDLESDKKLYFVAESGIVVVKGRRSRVDVSSMCSAPDVVDSALGVNYCH
ncbi:MAG: hypothetical protein FJW36_13480 [Acidobacteria bacterium]|nr:hypothetical protein [Acidobacteriota bacterium]